MFVGVSEKSHNSGVRKFIRMNMVYIVLKCAIPGWMSNINLKLRLNYGQAKKSERIMSKDTISHSSI